MRRAKKAFGRDGLRRQHCVAVKEECATAVVVRRSGGREEEGMRANRPPVLSNVIGGIMRPYWTLPFVGCSVTIAGQVQGGLQAVSTQGDVSEEQEQVMRARIDEVYSKYRGQHSFFPPHTRGKEDLRGCAQGSGYVQGEVPGESRGAEARPGIHQDSVRRVHAVEAGHLDGKPGGQDCWL